MLRLPCTIFSQTSRCNGTTDVVCNEATDPPRIHVKLAPSIIRNLLETDKLNSGTHGRREMYDPGHKQLHAITYTRLVEDQTQMS